LRRIQWDLIHFPRHLSFDPYLAPPVGEASIWTPAFDWLLAALVQFSVGAGDWPAAERLLIWVPPVLGGATVVMLHALAYPRFGPRVAGLAALVLSLLPAHVQFSQIGYIDHHCAVSLASVSLMFAVLSFLHRSAAAKSLNRSAISVSVLLGLLLGGVLLLWPGALLHVVIAETALLCSVLASLQGVLVRRRVHLLALAHFVAFALVLIFWLNSEQSRWEGASPILQSSFQPWLFAVVTLYFGVLTIVSRRRVSRSPLQRTVLTSFVGSLCLVAIWLLVPDAEGHAFYAYQLLSASNRFGVVVSESMPLHTLPRFALTNGTGFILLAPVLIPSLALWARGRSRAAEYWTIAWWSLALLAAVSTQRRFFNSFAIPFSLLIAWGWHGLHTLVARHFEKPPIRLGLHVAVVAGALALFSPSAVRFEHWRAQLANDSARNARGFQDDARLEAAQWLRANTPATAGYLDVGERPEYTLLSAWGDGHFLRYVAERAPVADNFALNFFVPELYFAAESEDESLEVVAPLGVRYVVLQRSGSGHNTPYGPRSHFKSLFLLGGSGGRIWHKGVLHSIDALTRHRLIFGSQLRDGQGMPIYRIFEIVKGARAVGEAAPGSTVHASLLLRGVAEEPFRYRTSVLADETGRFELRLPYSTDRPSGQFYPSPTYRLRNGTARALLVVGEEAVRLGHAITAPGFTEADAINGGSIQ
jgi:dolichyl-diphosphooligosaccharide--protein glycosyltransferase